MSKLYAIRQTGKSNYWYDFVEDFTSVELNRDCISNNFTYVKECQNNLETLNPAWKNSEIVEFRELGEKDDFEDLYYKSLEQRADLETKLAESEEYEEMLLEEKSGYIDLVSAYADKCKNYNKQLAEKEKEIEKYKQLCTISKLEDLQIENMLLKGKDQDKISFCIEQLEKLRKHYCHLMWDGRSASDSWVIQECVDLLDKELKQLTHQHEDKGE